MLKELLRVVTVAVKTTAREIQAVKLEAQINSIQKAGFTVTASKDKKAKD